MNISFVDKPTKSRPSSPSLCCWSVTVIQWGSGVMLGNRRLQKGGNEDEDEDDQICYMNENIYNNIRI